MSREQDRRDAAAWAQEWQIRRKNRRIILIVSAIIAVIALYFIIGLVKVQLTRTTYGSEEEMRAALQGRFETDYAEDIEIIGDDIYVTYYEISHYDADYAETYGYSEYGDYVYDDRIVRWDYRHGVIKCSWMSDIIVNKDGDLVQYSSTVFRKTDADKPVPIDPSTLGDPGDTSGTGSDDWSWTDEETEDALDMREDSLEELQDEAEDAGVLPLDEDQIAAQSGN